MIIQLLKIVSNEKRKRKQFPIERKTTIVDGKWNEFEVQQKKREKRRELKKNLWHQQTAPDHSRLKNREKCKIVRMVKTFRI